MAATDVFSVNSEIVKKKVINIRLSIFKKAKRLQDKISIKQITTNSIILVFPELKKFCKECKGKGEIEGELHKKCHGVGFKRITYEVEIVCNGKYTYLKSCDCDQHIIHGRMPEVEMKNLCSYVLASYMYLGK